MDKLSDCHCHLDAECRSVAGLAPRLGGLKSHALMSTSHLDLELVAEMAGSDRIVPFYGVHPWYSHLFAVVPQHDAESAEAYKARHYASVLKPAPDVALLAALPHPMSLARHLRRLDELLTRGGGVGEIGLDKVFRVPLNGFYGNAAHPLADNAPKLSPCHVNMQHQTHVLEAQLALAVRHGAAVSLHCVKAHGSLYDACQRHRLRAVVLHSYSGSLDQARAWLRAAAAAASAPQRLFFSLSQWINARAANFDDFVALLPRDSVLLETDLSLDRTLATDYYPHMQAIFANVCRCKNWSPDEGAAILAANWSACLQ
ncbi:Metallo-dependent hydrolase [[Candida] zeylanoides]